MNNYFYKLDKISTKINKLKIFEINYKLYNYKSKYKLNSIILSNYIYYIYI